MEIQTPFDSQLQCNYLRTGIENLTFGWQQLYVARFNFNLIVLPKLD